MWTCTTAAPAAWHSFAVVTSSSSVTGSAGTAVLSASAPVGASVIRVAWAGELLVMTRACLLPPGRVHMDAPGPGAVGLAAIRLVLAKVAAGEGERHGPAGVDLKDHGAGVAVRGQLPEQRCARLGAPAGNQVLVLGQPGAVGHVHVGEAAAQFLRHRDRVGAGHGRVR